MEAPESVENQASLVPSDENTDLQINDGSNDKKTIVESEDDSVASTYSEGELRDKNEDSRSENETDVEQSEGSIILERQEGDGQESIPQKAAKVDDDEDKKNPQYIPKRGTFYEHDDRTADDIEAQEDEDKEKVEKEGSKKKLWQDKKERWSHDRFNDQEQTPKSKTELVQIYGYDIRNEDGPPRARRRRRYGRGPNKYTRDWKDEDAYNKTVPQKPQKKVQKTPSEMSEEFPPLVEHTREGTPEVISEHVESDIIERNNTTKQNQISNYIEERKEYPQREKSNSIPIVNNKQTEQSSSSDNKSYRVGSGRVQKSKNINSGRYEPPEPARIDVSDYKGFTTKVRMGRNFKNQNPNNKNQKRDNYGQYQSFSPNKRSDSNEQNEEGIESSMAGMSIQDSRVTEKGNQGKTQARQGSVPPRMQAEQKGSKRYSSIRQRSLPEANNPPVMPHGNYFTNDMNQPQQSQGTVIHQNPNLLQTPATITQLAGPPSIPLQQQVPAPNGTILQPPPQYAAPYPQPTAFIQAAVPPPTFLPQAAPPIINYVQTTPQFPAGYQSFPYPQSPSTELYQPQGGITYYSTDQQIAQRVVPAKRPKAAIPIVAPPSSESKRGDDERKVEYIQETSNID